MNHHFPMPKVYSYTRFSTPEQAAGDSYRRQMEAARSYADTHGLDLDESLSIVDLGVSAYAGANLSPEAGLGRFREAVENGLVEPGSTLLLESLDRLSRGVPRKAVRVLEDLVDAGIVVFTLADGQRYDRERLDRDPMAFMLAYMIAVRAHEESAMKARRVAAAWAEKRRKVRAGEAQRLTRKAPAWLLPDGDWWAIDEAKADTVRRVYAMTLAGQGEHSIAEALNREGVPVLGRGKQWHRSSVAKLLRNRAVIGDLVPGHIEHLDGRKLRVLEEPIPGAFPAIISETDWLAVRKLKDGETVAVRGRAVAHPVNNVLATLARCPICGSAMTRVSKGTGPKGGRPKLVCTRAKTGAGCVYRSVPLDAVEEAILSHPWFAVENVPAGEGRDELDREVFALEQNIAGARDHMMHLMEALRAHPSRAGARRLAELEQEVKTLEAAHMARDEQRRLVDGGLVRDRAHRLYAALTAEEPDKAQINANLRQLFSGVVVDYREGVLRFQWKQGGESVVQYAYGFGDETAAA